MNILFAGSPDIAVPSLVRLSFEHRIVGLLTNPEAQKGRGLASARTPAAEAAEAVFHGKLPILAFERLGAESREAVAALEPDILVSFAYGRIFGPKFLGLFPKGGINVHPSLLPRWRGASPIPHAILHRDAETGISVQRIAPQMDCGDLLAVESFHLTGLENAEDLSWTSALIGADLLSHVLVQIESGTERAVPQSGEVTYCGLLSKEDGLIDWDSPIDAIDAKVRAFTPWPGAWTWFRGQRLNVLEAFPYPHITFAAGPSSLDFEDALPGTILGLDKARGIMVQTRDGLVALRRLQIQHKKSLAYREFANGARDLAGTVLGLRSLEEPPIP